MSAMVTITRAGPLLSVQDAGRPGMLRHGVGASGPMDRSGFVEAGHALEGAGAALEFTTAGCAFTLAGETVEAGFAGGVFGLKHNGRKQGWPCRLTLSDGDRVDITPGPTGNYGYVRFNREINVPRLMGSRATNLTIGLGGLSGRALNAGDALPLVDLEGETALAAFHPAHPGTPIRVLWGIHADLFSSDVRQAFVTETFQISPRLDRMGIGLADIGAVFAGTTILSLVSDAVVPGDIQILGDGTPIVLMRDHQPTGGYPRIATVLSIDMDRLAQLRPGTPIRFQPVTPARAQVLLQMTDRL